jgi:hypothetical protein
MTTTASRLVQQSQLPLMDAEFLLERISVNQPDAAAGQRIPAVC